MLVSLLGWWVDDDKFDNSKIRFVCFLKMMWMGHVLNHMPDHVLDHIIISLVITALHWAQRRTFQASNFKKIITLPKHLKIVLFRAQIVAKILFYRLHSSNKKFNLSQLRICFFSARFSSLSFFFQACYSSFFFLFKQSAQHLLTFIVQPF